MHTYTVCYMGLTRTVQAYSLSHAERIVRASTPPDTLARAIKARKCEDCWLGRKCYSLGDTLQIDVVSEPSGRV